MLDVSLSLSSATADGGGIWTEPEEFDMCLEELGEHEGTPDSGIKSKVKSLTGATCR